MRSLEPHISSYHPPGGTSKGRAGTGGGSLSAPSSSIAGSRPSKKAFDADSNVPNAFKYKALFSKLKPVIPLSVAALSSSICLSKCFKNATVPTHVVIR
jgi:hypothetical protein